MTSCTNSKAYWISKKIETFSRHDVYNHKIELTKDAIKFSRSRIYSLFSKKLETLNKYLKKNLFKKFINFNKIFFVSFILFVVKSNDQLKFCVNYRKLNVITKRNEYSISLIEETLTRVIECKHIFKLNIIFVFNRLRMNLESEKFITFIISLKIYKYHVLFFELTSELANWQHYMNDLLFKFLNKFCQIYANDILIYNKTRKKHERHLKQIFVKLKQIEFQMNINRCEFFKTKIIFLSVILFTKELRMNSNKIRDIVEWAQFTCLKDVQVFVKFCNFYRRFIKKFFKLIKFFIRMTRKKIDFEWFDEINQIFETLKK